MSLPIDPIRVTGLADLRESIASMSDESKTELLKVQTAAATLVASRARRKVPTRTGAARKAVKVVYGQFKEPRVTGASCVYFGWLDWGGNNYRHGSKGMKRVYKKQGRYIYPAYAESKDELTVMLGEALLTLCDNSGVEVN